MGKLFRHRRALIPTLLLAAFLLLPSMASVGMFLDGVIYAAVSRNLADGLGSIWKPYFSEGLFPVFHEHPPLVFWLQSCLFRVLGDSYLTERAYDLLVLGLTTALLLALWLRLVRAAGRPGLARFWWVVLLCWVLVPKWSWAYRNNMLENTMALWCLGAVLAVHAALQARSLRRALVLALVAAVASLAAFLSKGLPALFVLPAAVLLRPATANVAGSRVLVIAGVQSVAALTLLGLLVGLEPEARALFGHWWQDQVAARTATGAGWSIVPELLKKLAPMVIVALSAWIAVRRRWVTGWRQGLSGPVLAMLSIALAASLPLVFGDRDSAHYLTPSLPYFALGFGLIAAGMLDAGGPAVDRWLARPPGPAFKVLVLLAVLGIAWMCWGRIGEVRKNVEYHALFQQVDGRLEQQSSKRAELDPALSRDWMLHAVAQRHFRISLLPPETGLRLRITPANAAIPAGWMLAGEVGPWRIWERAP